MVFPDGSPCVCVGIVRLLSEIRRCVVFNVEHCGRGCEFVWECSDPSDGVPLWTIQRLQFRLRGHHVYISDRMAPCVPRKIWGVDECSS